MFTKLLAAGLLALAVVAGPAPARAVDCWDDSDCFDANACTVDTCDPDTLQCVWTARVCNDGNSCTTDGCNPSSGCTATPASCDDSNPCTIDSCNASTGCEHTTINCSDLNQCTADSCTANGCVYSAIACPTMRDACSVLRQCDPSQGCLYDPVVCPGADQCNTVSCNTTTGCSSPAPKANGTRCNDGNACTQTDTCQAGVCTGSDPVVCTPSDQCHDAGTCNAATGACSNPTRTNGSPCNDGNACTQTDACQGGICTGSNSVSCTAIDQCHEAGVCNTATGVCTNPERPNGSACSDGNACTQTDACLDGACAGSNEVVCTASDQCHLPGSCNPATGDCSNPPKPDGSSCSDGNPCTNGEQCAAGACAGGAAGACETTDAFVAYRGKAPAVDAAGAPLADAALPKGWVITIDDTQIGDGAVDDPENFLVGKSNALLLAAGLDGAAASSSQGYVRYAVKPGPQSVAAPAEDGTLAKAALALPRRWRLQNEFGGIVVNSKKAASLLVPAAIADGSAPAPSPATHYLCHQVAVSAEVTAQTPDDGTGAGAFRTDLQAFTADDLDDCAMLSDGATASFAGTTVEGSCLRSLAPPVLLCNPANTSAVEPPRTTTATLTPSSAASAQSLLCYGAKLAKTLTSSRAADLASMPAGSAIDPAQAKHAKRSAKASSSLDVAPGSSFAAPRELDTIKPELVCLPTDVVEVSEID